MLLTAPYSFLGPDASQSTIISSLSWLFCKLTFFVAFATTHRATWQLFFSCNPHFLHWKCPTTSWGGFAALQLQSIIHPHSFPQQLLSITPPLSTWGCSILSFCPSLVCWSSLPPPSWRWGRGHAAPDNQSTSSNWTLPKLQRTSIILQPGLRIRITLLMRIRIHLFTLSGSCSSSKWWESTTTGMVL